MDDTKDNELTYKEKQRQFRKEQYRKAKEKFKNSDRYKELKEKQKLLRKLAYQKAKNRKLKLDAEKKTEALPLSKLAQDTTETPQVSGPPKLRLIVNPDL